MHDQKFAYNVSRKDQTQIEVHKNVLNAIRIFATSEGLSFVATPYLIIKTGLETLLKMEKEQMPGKILPGQENSLLKRLTN